MVLGGATLIVTGVLVFTVFAFINGTGLALRFTLGN